MPYFLVAAFCEGGVKHSIISADSLVDAAKAAPSAAAIVRTVDGSLSDFSHSFAMSWLARPGSVVGSFDIIGQLSAAVRTLPPSARATRATHDGLPGVRVERQEGNGKTHIYPCPYTLSSWLDDVKNLESNGYRMLMSRSLPAEWNEYVDSLAFTFAPPRPRGSFGWTAALPKAPGASKDELDVALEKHAALHKAWTE